MCDEKEIIRHPMTHEVWMISWSAQPFLEEMVAQFCNKEEAELFKETRKDDDFTKWEVRPCASHS